MKKIILSLIIWCGSWLLSAILLIPCLFLSLCYGFHRDFHFEFHLWWNKKVLFPLNSKIF